MKFIKIQYPDGEFEMMDAPVTQIEWQKVMGDNPSYFKGKNNPVEMVSFEDVQNYIKKLNSMHKKYVHRLPTEQEWEFAAKSCDRQDINAISWNYENSQLKTHPVKKKLPNKLRFYDMLGNVWEWTSSLYFNDGPYRAFRGGSWGNVPQYLRSACRADAGPGDRSVYVGFRLVRTKISLDSVTLSPLSNPKTREAKVEGILKKIEELSKEVKELI